MAGITDEYRIIASDAGWIDRSGFGRLRFEGRDALSFLQALVTNDIASLGPGDGAYAAYLTSQGRMLADLTLHVGEGWTLVEVSPGMAPDLAARFDSLVFSEDVRISDVSTETAAIRLAGGGAAAILARALDADEPALTALVEPRHIPWTRGLVARSGGAPVPVYTIVAPAGDREAVIASLERAGAVAMSAALDDGMRVEAGRPLFGVDMTTDTIPLEAGLLDRAISTSKGCYVGQEVVIRMLHRGGGRVAKHVVTLALDTTDGTLPGPGAKLAEGDREVGHVTTAARSPMTGAPVALGVVRREAAAVDRVLAMAGGGTARITGFAR